MTQPPIDNNEDSPKSEQPGSEQPGSEQPTSEQPPESQLPPPTTPAPAVPPTTPIIPPGYTIPPQGSGSYTPPAPPAQPPVQPPQPYPGQGGYPGYQPAPPTNVFAIVSLIGAFLLSIAGIIFGHIALSQIKRTGEGGRGLALAGTIIGYVRLAFELIAILIAIFAFGFLGIVASSVDTATRLDGIEEPYNGPEDDFTDDYGEDGGDDPSASSFPWDGTDQEAFCNAVNDYDLSFEDEWLFYENLLQVTDDPEFKEQIERQMLRYDVDTEALSDAEYDEYLEGLDEWIRAHGDKLDACWRM